MAYQETNDTLNDLETTPEQAVEYRDQTVAHRKLRKSGALKKAAKKVLDKPATKKEG